MEVSEEIYMLHYYLTEALRKLSSEVSEVNYMHKYHKKWVSLEDTERIEVELQRILENFSSPPINFLNR